MIGFLGAASYPFRGVAYFLRRPALWGYAAAAFAVNLALFVVLAVLFWKYRSELAAWITPSKAPEWLRATLRWILTGAVALAALFLFTILGNLLASPFLDAMTARILKDLGETLPPSRGLLRVLLRALLNQSLKLVFFFGVQFALLLLLVTPAGFLHPPLSALLGILFLGFEYLDYPLDARGVGFPGRLSWLRRNPRTALGFGAVLFVALGVPLLGYLLLPLAVSGAALLLHDLDFPGSTA